MNKLEKELLENQLLRFRQTELPKNYEDHSLGINMFLLLQRFLESEIQSGWGDSKKVHQIKSFVNFCILHTFFLMSEIENDVKKNEESKNNYYRISK